MIQPGFLSYPSPGTPLFFESSFLPGSKENPAGLPSTRDWVDVFFTFLLKEVNGSNLSSYWDEYRITVSSLPPAYGTQKALVSTTVCDNGVKINSNVALTYSAGVALQELDLLIELDVVRPQAVQLILQGLHGLLHRAILLQVEMEETNSRGFTSPQKRGRGRENGGGGDLPLPAPGCESGISPVGWR